MSIRFIRRLLSTLFAAALALSLCSIARAAPSPVSVTVNQDPLVGDVSPYILNGTTYVPLSAFSAAMGSYTARWDGASAHVSGDGLALSARPGDQWVQANGRALHAPHGVQLVQGRTMVPLRVIAHAFGLEVSWQGQTNTAAVSGTPTPLEHGERYYDADTLYWLSRVISAESRGEPLTGQIAVGNVVLNRLASPHFPDTLYSVIFQPGQFEPVDNGTIHQEPYHLSVTAAKLCLEGARVIGPCLYFFAPALSAGSWIVNNRTYHTTIGCHAFYL